MRVTRRFPLRIRSLLHAHTQVRPIAATAQLGFILRRTTGSAVMRNRLKRVLRHQLAAFLAAQPREAWQQQASFVVTWEGPTPLTEAAIQSAVAVWRQWLAESPAPAVRAVQAS